MDILDVHSVALLAWITGVYTPFLFGSLFSCIHMRPSFGNFIDRLT
jgi:hypothetical protein